MGAHRQSTAAADSSCGPPLTCCQATVIDFALLAPAFNTIKQCCSVLACLLVLHYILLLCFMQLVLTHHDGQLGNHLAQHRTMVVQHVWVHLSTLMVDCFDKDAWLSAWDHCLSAGPNFQYLLLAAYLIHFRGLLLAATSKQQLQRFFTTKHPLDIHKVRCPKHLVQLAIWPSAYSNHNPSQTCILIVELMWFTRGSRHGEGFTTGCGSHKVDLASKQQ